MGLSKYGIQKVASLEIDPVQTLLYVMSKYRKKSTAKINVVVGDTLGGPRKETQISKIRIQDAEGGLIVCPNCLNVYLYSSLKEWYDESPKEFDNVYCFSCGKVKLKDILEIAIKLKGEMT